MSDSATPEGTPAGTPAPEATPAAEQPQGKVYDESYVKELRQEAAAARHAKKDAVEAAVKEVKEAHAAELTARDVRITELENELGSAWTLLQKYETTIDAKVPSDKVRAFVEILQGSDAESITESAKKNLELIGGFDRKPVPGFDPTQGFGGRKEDMPLNGDPILNAMKTVLGIS
ncbi:scaffolding protein [Mycobacterium phage Equemioh13]|uniref:Scaffolding protein n=1 Tax=Mycobacterium phage Centaur TaxID=2488784 RepID=A0A3G8FF09_9CAUD|nr:head scaffolding protein [Mycobacterium phage Equemioh13]YP_010063632.1 head scaffolding protein [Mycobacterium phage Centaur]AMB18505.1 scaffolding protein [Mycobacterium phage NaSiaTalie]ATN92258.1 scaffolding protein [Mycobacterium phage Updawg]AYD86290.1 scaffolding protein [Mycobacterium phage Flare16]QDM57218.1 scaffolding protein [Mycobacterium phage WideWale]QXN74044.1 scaffolding protein [Mycobacterium Phage MiculUcigas]